MTSPPPSETGASAEALTKAEAISRKNCQHLTQWMCCPVCVAMAIDEAKRSAHLEDARAVCDWCAMPIVPEHRECRARPIWDALSRTGGGK